MHRWQRRSLIRKIVDELHTLRDDELSDGLFDQSDNLDKLIFNACASVTALAETDDAYFALVLEEFSSLLKTMSDVVRRNAALSAELH
jgi:ABC-type transporter Mla subunit MlaD